MFGLFGTLAIVAAVLLILVVIIQNSKGGGINNEFTGTGAVQNVFGQRRSSEFIERLTWYLAAGVAVLAFLANVVGNVSDDTEGTNELRIEKTLNGEVTETPSLPNQADLKEPTPEVKTEAAPATEEKK